MASKVILEARAREFAAEPVGRHSTRPPMTWRRGIDKQSVQQSQSLPPLPAFKFIGTLSAARACAVLATKRLLPRQATWAVADAEGHDVLVHDEVQRFRGCGIYQNKPNCVPGVACEHARRQRDCRRQVPIEYQAVDSDRQPVRAQRHGGLKGAGGAVAAVERIRGRSWSAWHCSSHFHSWSV